MQVEVKGWKDSILSRQIWEVHSGHKEEMNLWSGVATAVGRENPDVFTGARWTMDFESQAERLDFSSNRFSGKQCLRITCWSGPHRMG